MSTPELERSLQALAAEVEWPPTPELRLQLEAGPRPARRRRALVLVVVLLLLAVAVAFTVPSARTAILRFFHLRGATVELVDTLPAAQERALGAGLGPAVGAAQAERDLGFRFLLPPGVGRPPIHELAQTGSVLLAGPEPLLLTELRPQAGLGGVLFKKIAGSQSGVEWVTVNGESGLWISGGEHVFFGPGAPARLAGNTLLWQRGDLTLRLEGKHLTRAAALRLATSIE
jgi:hypothetical protein